MSIIAIDYDGTYSSYKEEIDLFVEALKQKNHKVYLVTARNKEKEPITSDVSIFDKIFYTDGQAKAHVVRADIWLDDCPVTLCCDFVPGAAHAQPSNALHQGYKDTHILWNYEEGKFVSYISKQFSPYGTKDND